MDLLRKIGRHGRRRFRQASGLIKLAYAHALTGANQTVGSEATQGKRKTPHILFVTEKWCDCKAERGLSNNVHNFFGSLRSTGLATFDNFFFDELVQKKKRDCDGELLRECILKRPDALIYTWVNSASCPSAETFGYIRHVLRIPIVAIWCEVVPSMHKVNRWVDVSVPLVGHSLSWVVDHKKNLSLCTPQDPAIFYDPNRVRDIDISFVGSISKLHYTDRRAALNHLKRRGINVLHVGGQRENPVSIQEYAEILQRSKITLNFSLGSDGVHHLKGRVTEALLCGTLLVENKNTETSLWLDPGKDYVQYTDLTDLSDKLSYYLANRSERLQIADNGKRRVEHQYDAYKFWERILLELQLI
jgi:glycosyltransferase involved in cell wall biosynthesis